MGVGEQNNSSDKNKKISIGEVISFVLATLLAYPILSILIFPGDNPIVLIFIFVLSVGFIALIITLFRSGHLFWLPLILLIAVIMFFFLNSRKHKQYRDSIRFNDMGAIRIALKEYSQSNGRYPDSLEGLIDYSGKTITNYRDPKSGKFEFYYQTLSNNSDYKLCTHFERRNFYNDCINED